MRMRSPLWARNSRNVLGCKVSETNALTLPHGSQNSKPSELDRIDGLPNAAQLLIDSELMVPFIVT